MGVRAVVVRWACAALDGCVTPKNSMFTAAKCEAHQREISNANVSNLTMNAAT